MQFLDLLKSLLPSVVKEWLLKDFKWILWIGLLIILISFYLIKSYLSYNFKETIHSTQFLVALGAIFFISGIIFLLTIYKEHLNHIENYVFGYIFIFLGLLILVIFTLKYFNGIPKITKIVNQTNIPRAAHMSVKLKDGKILIIGGILNGISLKNSEIFDPNSLKFISIESLNIGRSHNGAILLKNGNVFIVGDNGIPKEAEIFDINKNEFRLTNLKTISQHNSFFTLTLLNDERVLIIGSGQSSFGKKTEIYDPHNDKFINSFDLKANRMGGHTATLLKNGHVLIVGGSLVGSNIPSSKTAEQFIPETGFILKGDLGEARRFHTATLLPSGKVLIIGGISENTNKSLASVEIFDPRSGYFSFVGSLNVPRWGHTSTMLPDGSVIVIGGFTNTNVPTDIIERYDRNTQKFKIIGRLRKSRALHTTTSLNDGSLLIIGGVRLENNFSENNVLKSVEILKIF